MCHKQLAQRDKGVTVGSTKWPNEKRREPVFGLRWNRVGSEGQGPLELGPGGCRGVYQDKSGNDDGAEKAEGQRNQNGCRPRYDKAVGVAECG